MVLPAYNVGPAINFGDAFSPMQNALMRYNDNTFRQASLENDRTRIGLEGQRVGLEARRVALDEQSAGREQEKYLAQRFGAIGQMIYEAPSDKQGEMFNRFVAADPRFGQQFSKYLPAEVANDPVVVSRYMMKLAEGYQTPQQQAQLGQTQAQTAALRGQESRSAALAPFEQGLKAREFTDPQQKITVVPDGASAIITDTRNPKPQVIAGGTPKMSDNERTAVRETDDAIAAHQQTLQALDRVKKLSALSYGGIAASARATIAANLGIKAGQNTMLLENEASQLALGQLRATFGGNPTEGERAIMISVQGAPSQPHEVRLQIYQQAEAAVRARLGREQLRADQLRSRTYFQPSGGAAPQQSAWREIQNGQPELPKPVPQVRSDADYDALPAGSRFVDPNGRIRTKP